MSYNGSLKSGEHPTDQFYKLDNLKIQSASVAFCRSSRVYSGRNGSMKEWPAVVSTDWWDLSSSVGPQIQG